MGDSILKVIIGGMSWETTAIYYQMPDFDPLSTSPRILCVGVV